MRGERRSKYGNVKTVHAGAVFDSKLEADVARVLDLLRNQGRILGYERQVPYVLAAPRKGLRRVSYVADFLVFAMTPGRACVLEAKGFMPAVARLKLRWFRDMYPDTPLHVVHAPQEVSGVIEALERELVP